MKKQKVLKTLRLCMVLGVRQVYKKRDALKHSPAFYCLFALKLMTNRTQKYEKQRWQQKCFKKHRNRPFVVFFFIEMAPLGLKRVSEGRLRGCPAGFFGARWLALI